MEVEMFGDVKGARMIRILQVNLQHARLLMNCVGIKRERGVTWNKFWRMEDDRITIGSAEIYLSAGQRDEIKAGLAKIVKLKKLPPLNPVDDLEDIIRSDKRAPACTSAKDIAELVHLRAWDKLAPFSDISLCVEEYLKNCPRDRLGGMIPEKRILDASKITDDITTRWLPLAPWIINWMDKPPTEFDMDVSDDVYNPRTQEVADYLHRISPNCVCHFNKRFIREEWVAGWEDWQLSYIPTRLLTREFILSRNGLRGLKAIPARLIDEEVVRYAIDHHFRHIETLPDEYLTASILQPDKVNVNAISRVVGRIEPAELAKILPNYRAGFEGKEIRSISPRAVEVMLQLGFNLRIIWSEEYVSYFKGTEFWELIPERLRVSAKKASA